MGVENAEALGIAFLGVATHHLHAHTYAEHGVTQVAYHCVEPCGAQTGQCFAAVAYSGQKHAVGLSDESRIGCEGPFGSDAGEGVAYGAEVAGGIVNYSNHILVGLRPKVISWPTAKGYEVIRL